jgi:hypothetical protein
VNATRQATAHGMTQPARNINGQNGFVLLSRDGEEAIKGPDGFDRIRALRSFPKELHPSIAKDAWGALQRGDFSTAVRDAFTMVEITRVVTRPTIMAPTLYAKPSMRKPGR